MNKIGSFGTAFLFLLLGAAAVFAQQSAVSEIARPVLDYAGNRLPDYFTTGEVTGRLGGAKAIHLERPVFSDEARARGVEGRVRVRIVINEDGNVTQAEALAGEPSLREAAVKAARLSRFSAPAVNGQKTSAEGHLNYDFIIERPNWFAVGYGLMFVKALPPGVMRKALAADWTPENAVFDQLAHVIATTPEPARPTFVTRTVEQSGAKIFTAQRAETAAGPPPVPLEAAAAPLAWELTALLQKRLAGDPLSLWQLNLGLELPHATASHRLPSLRANAVANLRQLHATAPAGVAPEVLAELQRLVDLLARPPGRGFMPNQGATIDIHREVGKAVTLFARKN